MNRPRGRPVGGEGLDRDRIIDAALNVLQSGGSLSLRNLAVQLGVTPMSLYRHVGNQQGLLRLLADRVHGEVMRACGVHTDPVAEIHQLLVQYHQAVMAYPALTLALAREPQAGAHGQSHRLTQRLRSLLDSLTPNPDAWGEILIDHAHGHGVAAVAVKDAPIAARKFALHYEQALSRLLIALRR